MAQDATGAATSPDNIPTYNTAVDNPSGKGSNAQMAAIQTALSARVGTPAGVVTGEGVVWNGTTWVRSSATKLASGNFGPVVNADIDPAAAIAYSKMSNPGGTTTFLRADGTFATPAGLTTYRKTTAKTVNTTVAETDLLNGEITIAANQIGATGIVRITSWGDVLNNSGGATAPPRFKLKLGATTLLDTNTIATGMAANATRWPWSMDAIIMNSATNVQWAKINIILGYGSSGNTPVSFITGEGRYQTIDGTDFSGAMAIGGNSGAVDTTAAQALVFSTINGSANAAYETKLMGALVEII